jgi:hypothetical protein
MNVDLLTEKAITRSRFDKKTLICMISATIVGILLLAVATISTVSIVSSPMTQPAVPQPTVATSFKVPPPPPATPTVSMKFFAPLSSSGSRSKRQMDVGRFVPNNATPSSFELKIIAVYLSNSGELRGVVKQQFTGAQTSPAPLARSALVSELVVLTLIAIKFRCSLAYLVESRQVV